MLYTIQNNKITLQVSSMGAEIKSLKFEGVERIHDSNPKYWNRSAPLLFPCIGTITNGETKINGTSYPLSKHGFLRDQEAKLYSKTSNELIFQFTSNEKTLTFYPFHYEVLVRYSLNGNQLASRVQVKNLSSEKMPFHFGLHPAFKTSICEDEKFEDYEFIIQTLKTYPVLSVNLENGTIDFDSVRRTLDLSKPLPLNYSDYAYDALVFDQIDFDTVTLQNKKATHGVTFQFSPFPMLGIWTPYPKNAPFICIEPWIGCADPSKHDGVFEHKKYIQVLNANEEKEIIYTWTFF